MEARHLIAALTVLLYLVQTQATYPRQYTSSISRRQYNSRYPSYPYNRPPNSGSPHGGRGPPSGGSKKGCPSSRLRPKPNVIFIMADDVGWNDVGFHNHLVKTPNINWLARHGLELTDVHAQPLCSPSRAAVLTGLYPSNNGMQHLVQLGQSKSCLPIENKLWPQYMKELGYVTKMVGKWHLGACDRSCLPTNRGFDEFRGILENQAGYFNWSDQGVMNRLVNDQPSIDGIGTHLTIQHQLDSVDMIQNYSRSATKDPLFMYVSPLTAHQPLENTRGMFSRHDFLDENDPVQLQRRKFLGLVSALDDVVGAILRTLKKENMLDNTYIVFTSDNGGPSADLNFPAAFPFISFGNNYPLRGAKSSFFDGGTKSPTIFFKPKLIRSCRGQKRDFLMHLTDWVPTFLDIVDPHYRPINGLDGVSQKKNLFRRWYKSSTHKYSIREDMLVGLTTYTVPPLLSECSDEDAAFRWKDWKLIYGKFASAVHEEEAEKWIIPAENPNLTAMTGDSCMKPDPDNKGGLIARCLFNLKEDPFEQRDLFNSRPDIVQKLLARINQYKRISKQNIFAAPSLPNPSNTQIMFGDVLVPRFDYCTPHIDFPLRPRNASCNANLPHVSVEAPAGVPPPRQGTGRFASGIGFLSS